MLLLLGLNGERDRAGAGVYRDVVEEDTRDRRVYEQTNKCQKWILIG